MSWEIAVFLIIAAFFCELIDSSMGMLYGTILSPALILLGFPPLSVVPAILLSQAIGGGTASILHHHYKNVDFSNRRTTDSKAVWLVSGLGVIATITAVFVAVKIPKAYLTAYIGTLVTVMGLLLLLDMRFNFSWSKIGFVAILSAFNKSLSGGGYGPIVCSGQIIAGRGVGNSVGVTTAAEVPITIIGFVSYFFIKGIGDWQLVAFLVIGAACAGPLGARLTAKFRNKKWAKTALGALAFCLGLTVLLFRLKA